MNPDNTAKTAALFGPYEIQETVGQGGMGVVYRAHDTALDRAVALKVLKDDLRAQSAVVARFQREGEAFAKLNHPNIVHIFSVGKVGDIPYLAMEFIDGEPLARIMNRERRLDWKRSLHIAEQVAEALASAHEQGVIHRDIKPGNILVDKNNKAFVTDFGIAKILSAETQLTLDGSRLGTPQYMSPERCQNKEVSPASDIYSLGVLLFQMIAAHLPYDAETPVSLIRQITFDPPRRLRDYVREIPSDVERLVAYLVEKDPRDRPPDAHAVALLCRRVREGKPLVDDSSGMSAALANFRDNLGATTPFASSDFDSQPEERTIWRRFVRSRIVQTVWRPASAALLAVLVGSTLVGVWIAEQMNAGYAFDEVRAISPAVDRWQIPPTLAEFHREGGNLAIASLRLNNFGPEKMVWGGGRLYVGLVGQAATDRAGESALAVLNPAASTARLLFPPAPAETMPVLVGADDEYVYGFDAGEREVVRWQFAPPESRSDAAARHFDWQGRAPAQIHAWLWRPGGQVVLGSYAESPKSAVSLLQFSEQRMTVTELWADDGPIRDITMSPAANAEEWNLALRRELNGNEAIDLLRLRGEEVQEGPTRLDREAPSITTVAMNAAGLLVMANADDALVQVFDAATQELLAQWPGTAAAWAGTPDQYVVYLATDHRNQQQVWLASVTDEVEPVQWTFVEGGVAGLAPSPDGRAAALRRADTARAGDICLVNLPESLPQQEPAADNSSGGAASEEKAKKNPPLFIDVRFPNM